MSEENFRLDVREVSDMEALFGLSLDLSADGWAVVDGTLWRYCTATKTRWNTGWARSEPIAFRQGFPFGVDHFEIIEMIPVAVPG